MDLNNLQVWELSLFVLLCYLARPQQLLYFNKAPGQHVLLSLFVMSIYFLILECGIPQLFILLFERVRLQNSQHMKIIFNTTTSLFLLIFHIYQNEYQASHYKCKLHHFFLITFKLYVSFKMDGMSTPKISFVILHIFYL